MTCDIIIFDLLGGTPDTGGTWTLVSSGPTTLNVDGAGDVIYNNGDTLGVNHNPTVSFTGTTAGTFSFNYAVGTNPCDDNQTIGVTVVDGATAGVDVAITYCDSDANAKILFNLLTGADSNGEWSSTTETVNAPTYTGYSANSAGDPTDDTFTPSVAGIGTYEFYYIVNNSQPDTPSSCESCKDESLLTITVTDAANAGTGTTITVCNNN